MLKPSDNNHGFTLVELMITLVISGIIIVALYSSYILQQRSYVTQDQVAEMQQNLRAAMDMLTREIRMAGFNPTGTAPGVTITTASTGRFSFAQDLNGDGDTADAGELIDFGFSTAIDANRDGIPDAFDANGVPVAASLGRQVGGAGGYQAIADNIQAIELRYLDSTGAVTAVPANVRSVQLSILARAGQRDSKFTNTTTYTTASGASWDLNGATAGTAANDNFRRRLLVTTVQCRNMGL